MSEEGHGAFGAPGIAPRWTSSSKEGVGTAYHTASRVWFTLSHGILNEVYYPTIDRPQIRDFQFLITDGESFFHEEKRDLIHRIEYIERHTLGYRIESADREGRYRIVKEVISDPHEPCVLIRARIEADGDWRDRLQVYALLAPHLEVGGWGNSVRRVRVAGRDILVARKRQTFLAMGADVGFTRISCGYVGASDGWQDLKENFRLDWEFDRAENGNVAAIGQIAPSKGGEFTVGLAFGDTEHAAVTTLFQSLSVPFVEHRERYIEQWHRVCCEILDLDRYSSDRGRRGVPQRSPEMPPPISLPSPPLCDKNSHSFPDPANCEGGPDPKRPDNGGGARPGMPIGEEENVRFFTDSVGRKGDTWGWYEAEGTERSRSRALWRGKQGRGGSGVLPRPPRTWRVR